MAEFAIVAIGYNRPESMKRLLKFLAQADYDHDPVDLIISIDNSGNDAVEKVAEEFEWNNGEKRVRTFPERQGLRRHILQCGNLVEEYRAIAVFEDDVIPAEGFYHYMKAAVKFYENDDRIAGISLYTHLWNVNANLPFQPAYSEYDTYFMQFAQSWGQVWMKRQWLAFAEWYNEHDEEFSGQENIPAFVSGWPKTSWLKYHIKYCIEKDKYFVYPYKSLSTCFSDVGEHCSVKDTHLQVPMQYGVKNQYAFSELEDTVRRDDPIRCVRSVRYDAFFERVLPENFHIGKAEAGQICMNLYEKKPMTGANRYVCSTALLPYKAEASFGMELAPMEENMLRGIEGNDIFLYDTEEPAKVEGNVKEAELKKFRYIFRLYGSTGMLVECVKDKVKRKIKKK